MASVFTYDPEPTRVTSPWSLKRVPSAGRHYTPTSDDETASRMSYGELASSVDPSDPRFLEDCGISKLEAEPQEGPTEYKLHLLLRPRRKFTYTSTSDNALQIQPRRNTPTPRYETPQSSPLSLSHSRSLSATSTSNASQRRLEQLTTQLLWRLQQSSPFHSSSSRELVLPLLPEANATLSVPERIGPLLSGLEESQGALYEIGVSDDGAFVGLTEDEMAESLINLRAMAASLGCRVDVLRKVAVGYCRWIRSEDSNTPADDTQSNSGHVVEEKLWTVEALVYPALENSIPNLDGSSREGLAPANDSSTAHDDLPSKDTHTTPYLHIAMAGPSSAGKSSLLGVLSTSSHDNGRGKSRLSLLRHRHEIISGMTSSVAQELVGYPAPEETQNGQAVINYGAGNISVWNDIHAAAEGGRLVFLSDMPGSLRYMKSTLRGIMGWNPDYFALCIPANSASSTSPDSISDIDLSLWYLNLFIKLGKPVVVVITKMDTATRTSLGSTLADVLSAVKRTNRKPVVLSVSGHEQAEQDTALQFITSLDQKNADAAVSSMGDDPLSAVPIVLTSSVTGAGIGELHALFRSLPFPPSQELPPVSSPDNDTQKAIKLFNIIETYKLPRLRVYSTGENDSTRGRGPDRIIILCGRACHGRISLGDQLLIGPLSAHDSRLSAHGERQLGGISPQPSSSVRSRDESDYCASEVQARWVRVKVVSVRNLRLPTRTLEANQIGTVGVEPIESRVDPVTMSNKLSARVRKGMALVTIPRTGVAESEASSSSPSSTPSSSPPSSSWSPHLERESNLAKTAITPGFHTEFTAIFSTDDAAGDLHISLAPGTYVTVYINGIRAAARVSSSSLRPSSSLTSSALESATSMMKTLDMSAEPFFFDDDNDGDNHDQNQDQDSVAVAAADTENERRRNKEVALTFTLLSSPEWIEGGSLVLVMPGNAATVIPASGDRPLNLGVLVGTVSSALVANKKAFLS